MQWPNNRGRIVFANVPIDGHLAKNRALEGEAQRRQQAIGTVLDQLGIVPAVIVHRGHAFWVQKTLSYLANTARLVILGSCGGTTEVHAVIEASHEAQVIATRGIGATEIKRGHPEGCERPYPQRRASHPAEHLLARAKNPFRDKRPLP